MRRIGYVLLSLVLIAAISDIATRTSVVRMLPTTTPAAVANECAVYAKSDNKLYFQDGAGTEYEVSIAAITAIKGQAIDEDNADAFAINDQATLHAYHTDGLASSHLTGWTFDVGGGGTSIAISSVAAGASGKIAVTTSGAHGLAVTDVISQTNMSVTTYDGVFVVNTITSSTIYEVTATFSATATGTLDEGARLVASAGTIGDYDIGWRASVMAADTDETFDLELQKNASVISGTKMRRQFGPAGDYGSLGNGALVAITAGDVVTLALGNNNSSQDLTLRHLTLKITKP